MNANHTAGAYRDGLQLCIICGEIITDDRDMHRAIDMATGKPPMPPSGFPEGPVYRLGNLTSVGRLESLPDCSPNKPYEATR